MGTKTEQVFESFTFTNDGNNEKFDPVMERFDAHFVPKTNVIHERSTFNKCVQQAGETVESFVRRLFELLTNCNYGDNRRDQIRDRLIVGLIDKDLSKKLQLPRDTPLTLDVAIQKAMANEMVKIQVSKQTNGSVNTDEVYNIRGNRGRGRRWGTRGRL